MLLNSAWGRVWLARIGSMSGASADFFFVLFWCLCCRSFSLPLLQALLGLRPWSLSGMEPAAWLLFKAFDLGLWRWFLFFCWMRGPVLFL
ncbi:hypothetical protein U1Q18_001085 [Sarracenia purpurea var. burkii]